MATVVVMPQLGNTVESCLLTQWLVAEGEEVGENTDLCAIETDKSAMEVPAGVAGTVLKLLATVGDDVPVKDPIAVVGDQGEDITDLLAELSTGSGAATESAPEKGQPESATPTAGSKRSPFAPPAPEVNAGAPKAGNAEVPKAGNAEVPKAGNAGAPGATEGSAVSPRARGVAHANALDPATLTGTGPDGRVIARDVEAAAAANPATKAAREQGVTGQGTGLGGRVTTADAGSAAVGGATATTAGPGTPASTAAASDAAPSAGVVAAGVAAAGVATAAAGGASKGAAPVSDEVTEVPVTGIRKVIAERMMASLATSAQLTLHTSAPADHLLALRARFKASGDNLGLGGVTIGDLVNLAVVRTVAGYPMLNATLSDRVVRSYRAVHLGIAVDTPRGLMVPTIAQAQSLSIGELSAQTKALAAQAIDGSINPDLLSGATFTVTNLGSFGIESFTPVLNVPQTGILGVSAITPRPRPDGGVEQRLGLSLTIDHQVVDGADGARFLRDLCDTIAAIDLMGWS